MSESAAGLATLKAFQTLASAVQVKDIGTGANLRSLLVRLEPLLSAIPEAMQPAICTSAASELLTLAQAQSRRHSHSCPCSIWQHLAHRRPIVAGLQLALRPRLIQRFTPSNTHCRMPWLKCVKPMTPSTTWLDLQVRSFLQAYHFSPSPQVAVAAPSCGSAYHPRRKKHGTCACTGGRTLYQLG